MYQLYLHEYCPVIIATYMLWYDILTPNWVSVHINIVDPYYNNGIDIVHKSSLLNSRSS